MSQSASEDDIETPDAEEEKPAPTPPVVEVPDGVREITVLDWMNPFEKARDGGPDFRPIVRDAEELDDVIVPKDSFAPESASSSDQEQSTPPVQGELDLEDLLFPNPKSPAKTATAAKASGQPKVKEAGTPAS